LSLKQFRQEIDKGFTAPVYLLYSTESFLLYEALTSIKGLFQDSTLFNIEIIDLASSDEKLPAEKIMDILNTMPFFGSKRIVALRNVQKWTKKEAKKFGDYLGRPSEYAQLLMLFEGARPDIFDPAELKDVKSIALGVSEGEIPSWINEKAAEKNIKFTPKAIECLIAIAGSDLGMLHSEIEKFALSHEGRVVAAEDVRGIVYAGAEYDAFDLAAALARKDSARVFRIFENLGRTVDPVMLLGALNWQYSNSGSRGSLPGMNKEKLRKVYLMLHEADMAVKTSHSHVIEDLLVKLIKL
jgi:DNA polymerase III subunit delta